MDMHQRLQTLAKTIEKLKMDKAKQEALMESAKAQRDELIEQIHDMGYTNLAEIPQVITNLEAEIEELLTKIEDTLAS